MLALGATLTIGAIAPQEVSAQTARERARGTTTPRADRRDVILGTIDGRNRDGCYEDSRDGRSRHKDKFKSKHKGKDHDDRMRSGRDDDDDDDHEDRARDGRDDEHERHDRIEHRRTSNRNDDCDDDDRRSVSSKKGNGPPFCRNGQGHPVHGMQWCRDKGWDNRSSMRNAGWEDVILRRPRDTTQRDLNRGVLESVLGQVVYGRMDQQRLRLGAAGPLVGRWLNTTNGSVLNVFAEGVQIAQFLDRNNDGRADVVLLNYGN